MIRIAALFCLFACGFSAIAQSVTKADYTRAVGFLYDNYNNKTAFNLYTDVQFMEDGEHLCFEDHDEEGKRYKKVNLTTFEISDLFDHDRLASMINTDEPYALELSEIRLAKDSLSFNYNDTSYVVNLKNYVLSRKDDTRVEKDNTFESKSPDGKWIAFVKDYNLYIRSTENLDQEFALTEDGMKNYEYASYYGWFDQMEGENGDRPKRFAVSWSPDSKYLHAQLVDLRNASKMYMLDYSKDELFRPTLHSYYRGSPGDTNMVMITPKFFHIEAKKEVKLNLPAKTHINNTQTRWTEKEGIVLANDVQRGFQKNTLLRINLDKATVEELFHEESETNIDDFEFQEIEGSDQILFTSQRSGWRQLYLYDMTDGHINSLTNGAFVVNDVIYVDEDSKAVIFAASGVNSDMNPYHQQIYKVNLDGSMQLLTPEELHHDAQFSRDGKFFVDNFSAVTEPTRTVLRSSENGEILAELTKANVDKLNEKGWTPPMTFSMTGKDGSSEIHGAIWRPTNFDPAVKYPIIDHSYTGPHTQVFPKSFDRALGNQALAELGFVVIMVDGLGTTGRSKAFANHSYKNMGNNLEDHVLAIKQLAEEHSWIDANKVGIFGHSAGGYDAGHGMLAFPDFYKVGVASSADHDFRMEKAWWPEMYMGWPVDSTYHEVSNITMAPNLKGKLLLVHGNMDDNVNVSATYKLAEALVKADKEFDLLIFPSQRHGYSGDHRKYFTKKRWNYFIEHLLEQKPIWDFNWD